MLTKITKYVTEAQLHYFKKERGREHFIICSEFSWRYENKKSLIV